MRAAQKKKPLITLYLKIAKRIQGLNVIRAYDIYTSSSYTLLQHSHDFIISFNAIALPTKLPMGDVGPNLVVELIPSGPMTSFLRFSQIGSLSPSRSTASPRQVSVGFLDIMGIGIFEPLLGRGLPPEVDIMVVAGFGGVPGKWPATVSLRVKILICEADVLVETRVFEVAKERSLEVGLVLEGSFSDSLR